MKPTDAKYCGYCGKKISAMSGYCGFCGRKLEADTKSSVGGDDNIISGLNRYLGNGSDFSLNWRHLFSAVPNRHSLSEAETVFICGTKSTTPTIDQVSASWPKPWLYSRILLAMVAAFMLLYCCCYNFANPLAYPGLLIIGAFTVPIVTVVLFMEVNAYRDISIHKVLGIVTIGGGASLVATLFIFDLNLVDSSLGTLWGGMMVGLIEEIGKAIIVYMVMKRLHICHRILPAMLVGASVGAGFAAFESAGYAFRPLLDMYNNAVLYAAQTGQAIVFDFQTLLDASTQSVIMRGFLAPGGHVAWAAIAGAAIAISAKHIGKLSMDIFRTKQFWRIFIIPIVLHGLWDTPFVSSYLWYVGLIVAVWIVVLIFIDMGLKQLHPQRTLSIQQV